MDNQEKEDSTTTEKGAKGASQVPAVPYKDAEFEAFLDSLSSAAVPLWKPIAKTLGFHRNTISRWSKHPRAVEAKKQGLNVALEGMAMAGMTNYQMWEKYLHLLGLANNLDETDEVDAEDELTTSLKDLAEVMKLNARNDSSPERQPDSSEAIS